MLPSRERAIYHIVPNGSLGWNFKKAGCRTIIKLMADKNQLKDFALNYCKSSAREQMVLMIFDTQGKLDEVIPFESVTTGEMR